MGQVSFTVSKKFAWENKLTDKVAKVLGAFGMTVQRLRENAITHQAKLELKDGDICYLTGASGSGKSVLLRQMYESIDSNDKIMLNDIELESDKTCVDAIDDDYLNTLKVLSRAGLSDVFCVLNQPLHLSQGQKYRYQLAKAICSGKRFVFADEFCSNLDRITAAVIAHNIRKFANKHKVIFVLASAHDDLLCDLLPEVIVIKHLAGEAEVVYKN